MNLSDFFKMKEQGPACPVNYAEKKEDVKPKPCCNK
jgi:hypothetical protein